ncbi:MAG: hypothetical protein ACM336_13880 [Acidobacteriota bacterium]
MCLLLVSAAGLAADRELLKVIMPDARVVSGVNVAEAKKTPFGRFALARFSDSQDQGFDEFVKASGFDPRYNLDEIVIASPAAAGSDRKLIAARGTFAPARIIELARNAGAEIANFQGVEVISNARAVSSSPHGVPAAVAFLSESIAVAGDEESVRGAIARRQNGAGPGQDLAARVDAVSAASHAWFVSNVPVAELAQGLPDSNVSGALKGDALRSIRQASGGAVFGDPVRFSAEVITATAEDAANLADVVRFLSGIVQTSGPGGRQPLAAGLDLKAEGTLLKLGLSLPEAQLESLIEQAGR